MIYDNRLLLYFQAIATEHSISRAADKLYISQSSLSKFLKAIEDELGTKLVDRRTIPLKLTPAGERFLQFLKESSALYEKALSEITQLESEAPRELIIGTSSMNSKVISDAFPEFYSRYPNIQLSLQEGHSEDLAQLLMRRKIDMAVLVRNGNDINDSSGSFEVLVSQPRLIVVSRKNPLARLAGPDNSLENPQYLDIHHLENQKLIAGKAGQRIFEDMNEMVHKRRIPIRGFLETQSVDTMVSFAAKNYGVSFIPSYYLKSFLPLDDLVFFYSDYPELQWALTLEFQSSSVSIPERYFASIVKKVCGKYEKR
ncbi:MAG: LysR family transcriptional regulator [Dysosmobacter sp.]|nr:LysR family transcriptional regulator [Dysosmobacter sp.]